MTIVAKQSKPLEEIEKTSQPKLDLNILKKRSSAKTPSGLILSYAKEFKKKDNLEMTILFQELYKKIISMETREKVILKSWKGKSSIQIIEKPDYFIIITFQKDDQDSIPHEVKREIPKLEVNRIIKTISELNKGEKISTRDIGELAYKRKWENVFSDRLLHTNLNLILRLLDHYEIIRYRGRYTQVIKKIKEIQEVL